MKISEDLVEGIAMGVGVTIGIGGYIINGVKALINIPFRVRQLEADHKKCEEREKSLEDEFKTWRATTGTEIAKLSGRLEQLRWQLEKTTKQKERLTDQLLRTTGEFVAVEPDSHEYDKEQIKRGINEASK